VQWSRRTNVKTVLGPGNLKGKGKGVSFKDFEMSTEDDGFSSKALARV
jgi:hypothetical protein